MVTNAVTTRNGNPGALDTQRTFYAIEGMENMGQNDFILPRKSIMQPTQSREETDEHIGHFWDNLTETTTPTIEAVILTINHAANKRSEDEDDRKIDCRSRDGITGSKYGVCRDCEFNPDVHQELWKLPSDEAKSLRCNRGYDLLCWDILAREMFFMYVNGTSVKPFKLFFSKLARQMRGRGALYSKIVQFSTQRVAEAGKKYYLLISTVSREATVEEMKQFHEIREGMAGVNYTDIDEAEEPTPPPDTYDDDPGPTEESSEAYTTKQNGMDF